MPNIDSETSFDGDAPLESISYPCLVVEDSPHTEELGLQFILLSEKVNVGRAMGCELGLKDPAIFRNHAALSVSWASNPPVVSLSNLSAQEGTTRINTQTLDPNMLGVLRQGDVLRLGNTSLRYGLFQLEPQISHINDTIVELMKKASYEKALQGLAALKKYQPVGGPHTSSLKRRLQLARYHEARIHALLGKWSAADELLWELMESDSTSQELRVKAAFQLGALYIHRNDLEQAQALVERAAETAQRLDGYFQALALCLRGMTAARLRDFTLARKAFEGALMHLQSFALPADNLLARIRLESAIATFLAEQHEQALYEFEHLKAQDCRNDVQRTIYAEALRYRGIILSLRRDYEGADALLREALSVFRETKSKFLECKAQKSRALNYLSWGRLGEATVHLQECQRLLATEVENEYERAVAAAHLGKVYLTRGEAHEALLWFERERNLQNNLPGVAHSRAYTHRNFARAHRNLGHAAEATQHYVSAVRVFREFSNWVPQALTLVELCKHRLETMEVEAAAADLLEAESCFRAAGRLKGFEPMLEALRAQLAWARGEHAQALALFASSLRVQEASPPSYLLGETYLSYGRLCAELHRRALQAQDTAAASDYHRDAKLLFKKGIECAASQSLGHLLELFRKEIEELDPREFTKLIVSRFVNPELLDQVVSSSFRELNKFQLDERTVVFVDLSGYTAMVEREDLAAVRDILNEFYGFATRIIHQHGGAVDKFIGDCVMAVFKGSTTAMGLRNQAVAAVNAVLAIIREVEHLSERRFSSEHKLTASAGVCSGKVLVGLVGSLKHMSPTCIGDVVNVASRLQGLAEPGEVLIANETYQTCLQGGAVVWVDGAMRQDRVKNREQPVRYWSLGQGKGVPPLSL
jgi:class 3 adenylate cyclase/tetratricopeptide (TPR) repeat protein